MNGRLQFNQGEPIEATSVSVPTHTVTARARCNDCPTTALLTTTHARLGKWPELPVGWSWCGELPNGEPMLWCGQCSYEKRFDKRGSHVWIDQDRHNLK